MKKLLSFACVVGVAVLVAGCAKKAGPEDCKKMCEHVTKLTLTSFGDPIKSAEEMYKKTIEMAKAETGKVREENAKTLKEFEDTFNNALKDIKDPAILEKLKADHAKDKADLEKTLAEAVKGADDAVKQADADWQKEKKELEDNMKKDLDKGVAECSASCQKDKPTLTQVKCVLDSKKLEDVFKCDK